MKDTIVLIILSIGVILLAINTVGFINEFLLRKRTKSYFVLYGLYSLEEKIQFILFIDVKYKPNFSAKQKQYIIHNKIIQEHNLYLSAQYPRIEDTSQFYIKQISQI